MSINFESHTIDRRSFLKGAGVLGAAGLLSACGGSKSDSTPAASGAAQAPLPQHLFLSAAVQVHGAAGLTDDTPLSFMYRAARFGRIYDGPDEVHVHTVARRILKATRPAEDGTPRRWEFAR